MLILLIILILVFGFGGYRMGPGLGYYGGGGLSSCSGETGRQSAATWHSACLRFRQLPQTGSDVIR